MTQKMEETCQEVAEVKAQLQAVHGHDGHAAESREDVHRGPVPKQLKVCAVVKSFNYFAASMDFID